MRNERKQQEPSEAEWPAHFPPCCPPSDAQALSGVVYMLVGSSPPTPKDMECAMDRGSFRGKPECLRASLSCARDPEHLRQLRANAPRLAKHLVAAAKLRAEHGKIKQTGAAAHYSMWLRAKYLSIGHAQFAVQHP